MGQLQPHCLPVGVVIGVLSSRVTWSSREQKPTCLDVLDVLLIFVFFWSLAICLFPIGAGRPVAREGGGGNWPDPCRSKWMVAAWGIPVVWVEEGGVHRKGTSVLSKPMPFQESKWSMLRAVL